MGDTVFEVRQVAAGYDGREVLHGVDLTVERGQMMALLGPNGSGKSTLVRVLSGVLSPSSGDVLLNAKALQTLSRREVAREVGVVSQMGHAIFAFSGLEYVMMGRTPHLGRLQGESQHDREVAYRAMADTDTEHLAERLITELSGGELQRLTIARCLAQETPALLLDEPTAFLDINHQLQVLGLLQKLNRTQGKTILCVSHDLNLTAAFFDKIALMKAGKIVAVGSPEEIITTERIAEVYGAEVSVDTGPSGKPRVSIAAPGAGDAQ